MKQLLVLRKYTLVCMLIGTLQLIALSCERKPKAVDTKEKLEKALTDELMREQGDGQPSRQFTVVDVAWYENQNQFDCEWQVRLHRPDGTDTTGMIRGTVSKDFEHVSKKR